MQGIITFISINNGILNIFNFFYCPIGLPCVNQFQLTTTASANMAAENFIDENSKKTFLVNNHDDHDKKKLGRLINT